VVTKRKIKGRGKSDAGPSMHTRERIMREAMLLFATQGYTATTVTQIESAAGLSPGSGAIYRHFATKQDILVAGFAEARARVLANRAAATAVAGSPAPPVDDVALAAQLSLAYDLILLGSDNAREISLLLMKEGRILREVVGDAIDDWLSESLTTSAHNMEARRAATKGRRKGNDDAFDALAEAYLMLAPVLWARIIEWTHGSLPAGLTHERIRAAWVRQLVAVHGEHAPNETPRAPRERSGRST
jgi:AcrR family transcriptional regulator